MKDGIKLPLEFISGNNTPVTVATIKRERMEEILRDAIKADRAALQSHAMSYAGVTVWVGDKRCSYGFTRDELELSTIDILQAAFDRARRYIEEEKK